MAQVQCLLLPLLILKSPSLCWTGLILMDANSVIGQVCAFRKCSRSITSAVAACTQMILRPPGPLSPAHHPRLPPIHPPPPRPSHLTLLPLLHAAHCGGCWAPYPRISGSASPAWRLMGPAQLQCCLMSPAAAAWRNLRCTTMRRALPAWRGPRQWRHQTIPPPPPPPRCARFWNGTRQERGRQQQHRGCSLHLYTKQVGLVVAGGWAV